MASKVLFIAPHIEGFIRTDIDLLRKHFEMEVLTWKGRGDVPKLLAGIPRNDVVFSWFAGAGKSSDCPAEPLSLR